MGRMRGIAASISRWSPLRGKNVAGVVLAVTVTMAASGAGAGSPDDRESLDAARKEVGAAIRGKSPAEQLALLRAMTKDGRDDAAVHFHLGNVFFALEEGDSALAHFRRASELDPGSSRALVNMGIVYDTLHQTAAARQTFRRAVKVNPRDILAYCHLGYTHYTAGEVNEAVDLWRKALEIDTDSPQARYYLGLAFADQKLFGEAIKEWQRVAELDPDGDLGDTARENVKLIRSFLELGK